MILVLGERLRRAARVAAGARVPRRRRPGRGRRDPRRGRAARRRARGVVAVRACSPRAAALLLLGRRPLWAAAGGRRRRSAPWALARAPSAVRTRSRRLVAMRPAGRDRRRPRAADPLQHGQPAGRTSARARSGWRATCATPASSRAARRGARAAEPRRAPARRAEPGPVLGLPLARRHRARRPRRLERTTRGRATSHDGYLWGRGALDMKSQTAAEVVAAATLARDGLAPAARRAEADLGRRRGDRRPARRRSG